MKKIILSVLLLFIAGIARSQCPTISSTGSPTGQFVFNINPTGVFDTNQVYIAWDFGDGIIDTSTGSTVIHNYQIPGAYSVCYRAYQAGTTNLLCTYCDSVIFGPVTNNCFFTWNAVPGTPTTISFTGLPAYPGNSLQWTFGNGMNSSLLNPVIAFNAPGNYNVCMTELDSLGNSICTNCQIITIGQSTNCSFSANQIPGSTIWVFFNNSNITGNVTWTFGDGTTATGDSVTHTYNTAFPYDTVCMTIYDPANPVNILCSVCQYISLNPGPSCSANFFAAPVGNDVYFIDMSITATASVQHSWSFGDGFYSSDRFPTHTYASPGTYIACHAIIDGNCTDSVCQTVTVTGIITPPDSCSAFFVVTQINPYELAVVNLSTANNITSYMWDFGDGTISTTFFPSHTYTTTGNYNLCLTIATADGCTSTYCDTIGVDANGNIIYRGQAGFIINVVDPATLTGIKPELNDISSSIYPNPSTESISVDANIRNADFSIMNITGSVVMSGKISKNEKLNISSLNPGIYMIRITENGTGYFGKLVKN